MNPDTRYENMDDIYRLIAFNVKRLRKMKGVSQLLLSSELGHSSPAFVARAENLSNGKHFNLEHIAKMAKIFNVEIQEFFLPIK